MTNVDRSSSVSDPTDRTPQKRKGGPIATVVIAVAALVGFGIWLLAQDDESTTAEPVADEALTDRPEADEPETDEPETDESETDESDAEALVEGPVPSGPVTGTISSGDSPLPADRPWTWAGWIGQSHDVSMSDPRVEGSAVAAFLEEGKLLRTVHEIANDGGVWRGMFTGVPSGCYARTFPYNERVGSKPLECGSAE